MDELSTGECKEDEEGEGDQESHFGHLHPTHRLCMGLYGCRDFHDIRDKNAVNNFLGKLSFSIPAMFSDFLVED